MKKVLLIFAALAALSGCRLGRYNLSEPVTNRYIEVKSGDQWTFELEENQTTGFSWIVSCPDPSVDVTIGHRGPEKKDEGLCGAPGKALVTAKIRRGFSGPSELTMMYRRPWSKEVAREVRICFYRKTGDAAPWK